MQFICIVTTSINRLKPNDPYMGHTAPLTSKRCILYIYSTNIGTEYFKHALYSPFFSLSSKCSLFHNANLFGSCIIHILYTGCANIKEKNHSGCKGLIETYHGRCTSETFTGDAFFSRPCGLLGRLQISFNTNIHCAVSLSLTFAICSQTSHMIAENPFGHITLVAIYPSSI